MNGPGNDRLPALDAARGALALVVVLTHLPASLGATALFWPSQAAVWAFFVMSGYVLARGYDGRPLIFVTRRIVRLWPTYALAVCAGHALAQTWPGWAELAWFSPALDASSPVDPPAWTLFWEAKATLFLPAMFWVCGRSRWAGVALAGACLALYGVQHRLGFIGLFASGAAAARFHVAWPGRIPSPLLWLGHVSYSLYITHWVVMWNARLWLGPWGAVGALPVVFVVAWATHLWVGRPSIRLSRALGRLNAVRRPADGPQAPPHPGSAQPIPAPAHAGAPCA